MNSRQLRWILSGDKFTKLSFTGVYAINEIKSIKTVSYPSSFLINLDPSYQPGSHWVAVYFDKNGVGEYFDSFASYPPHEIVHFLRSHAKGWQLYASARTLCHDMWTICRVLHLSKELRTDVRSHFTQIL